VAITVMASSQPRTWRAARHREPSPLWIKVAGLPKYRRGNQHIEGVQGRVESRVWARTRRDWVAGAMSPCLAWRARPLSSAGMRPDYLCSRGCGATSPDS
jgi:hypothetical protein